MNVCTIIAKNYVAHARVLARSLAETHPGSRLWTLVVDDFSRYLDPNDEPFAILTPADVGCQEFDHMALRYSVLELSTAVKPWLLRHLMGKTGQPITYLDPDIRIYGSLAALDDLAVRHGVVLTPHNSEPIPQDGRNPSQVDVMIAGIYNLGYVSLAPGPEVDRLLDWWADRLLRDCRVDPIWGYFVDQRWFDLAPGFLSDIAIVRDPEYNVAYWNLHQRRLQYEDGRYLVDGRPLAFFHFSGFDPERPLILSRHQNRIDVADQPVLERLLGEYAAEVMSEGHEVSRHWPYDYGALGDGTQLDDRLRDLFDDFADEHNGQVTSPFTLEGVRAFDHWLEQQAPGAPSGINRALARVYEDRADVRGAYPDVSGDDREPLLTWAEGPGQAEEPALARVMLSVGRASSAARAGAQSTREPANFSASSAKQGAALRGAPWGVNVVGDFLAPDYAGEIPRRLIEAMDISGLRALPVLSRGPATGEDVHAYAAVSAGDAPFTVSVICLGPDLIPEFVSHAGGKFFAGRYSVGLWMWPTELPDTWRERLSLLEEVWVPSAHVAHALQPAAEGPVTLVRIPVAPPSPEPRTRAELGLAEGFLFHARVDHRDALERQNPLAVIEAFRQAFAPGDGARLAVDCSHSREAPEAHARVQAAAAAHSDIDVFDIDRSRAEALSLLALSDCFVSLHRATAFGLALAEAMWLEKSVIATGYSGNLDFMTTANSHLVDHRLTTIGRGNAPYPAEAFWADPDVEHAARLMRRVFEDPQRAASLGMAAAQSIRATHSPAVAGELIGRRLESIRATGQVRRSADPISDQPRALAKLPLRLRQGPNQAVGGRGGSVRDQLRQAILRVIRPYSAYQQSVNADIVTALGELSDDVAAARDEAGAQRADMLAAARGEGAIPASAAQAGGVEEIKRILTLQTDRSVYLALSELGRRHELIQDQAGTASGSDLLTSFELRGFSQNGEDGVLAEILRRVGAPSRFFVEFGVESGREGNCVFLADAAGWNGLFMEAGDEMFGELESKYAAQEQVQTVRARVAAQNVEALFRQAAVPAEPDVVSIDVDGQDYWIWEAIEAYRARVVVIEYNSSLDPRRRLVQPDEPGHSWTGTEYYGASLGALEALGERKGYRLVHTELSGVNAFFVRSDLAGAFPAFEQVARRGTPNYYQRGLRHPSGTKGARYLDLDSGRLVGDVHVSRDKPG